MGTAMTCDKNGFAFEMVHHPDDDSSLNDTIYGSGEVFDTNIKDATNNKKTLALNTDLVIGLVKEVEGKERAMDLDIGLDVVAKVDGLKQDQHHAKETNETHTGEQYAQDADLGTEYKELEFPVTGVLKEGRKVLYKMEAAMIRDKNDFEVEMVNHPEENSALNNMIISSHVDTIFEDATDNKMDLCKAVTSDKNDFEFEMVNHLEAEDDSTFNNTITGSYELLDTTIEDAIDNKKTLASTMDLVISLMREVESKEKAAEQAKEEIARSGLDIIAKVDELQQVHQHAKETNETHARRVSAQKAVLTTDIKDLQSCVSGLLNEGGKLLGVLDEIRRALEMRLASAIREKELADKAKLEKESLAQKSLAYEESQMIKVVEESKRLTKEAVKISKDWAGPADTPVFADFADEHVPLANQKQIKNGKSISVALSGDEMLSEIPDLDLEKMEGNKNGSSETDINNEPAVADMTVVGHSISTEDLVVSAETNAERVALRSIVPKDHGKKSRGKKRKFRKMSGWGTVPRRIGCAGDPRGYF